MKRLVLIIVFILYASIYLSGLVVWNNLEIIYDNVDEGLRSSNNGMKTLIILGGGYFLESHAGFQAFLNKVELAELSGIDYEEMQAVLQETISAIESARTYYYELMTLAQVTPYNQTVIEQLKSFNYSKFCSEKGLNPVILTRVENFLGQGDVTGILTDMYTRTVQLVEQLYTVKRDVDKNIFPSITILWQISQQYFDAYLGGQYTAMVFAAIK